ncbi:hypothetical protein B0H11DRAFT_2291384 [Mycena galericulata]|nr:hypothetical protein B0H11DRAFT_2291384 [Mycena galericulata]
MATISLYTTAPSLSRANAILDTHINILPFSPDLIRMNCALQQLHPAHPPTAPIVSSDQIDPDNRIDALAARANHIAVHVAAGKLVVIKNGARAWPALNEARDTSHDVHIVITNHEWKSVEIENAMNSNPAAISHDMLRAWPSEFIIDATAKTIMEVQNILRSLIGKHVSRRLTGLSGDMMFKPYLHRQRLRVVVAFGGLSECGKSSMGGLVDTEFGQEGRREKIAYLFNNATKQLGLDIYTLPEAVQAHILIQQIEDYSKAHFWISVLSLESLHRFGSIAEAQRILWPLLQIVYIEVTEAKRISRQVSPVGGALVEAKIQELKDKDVVKRERGAELVKDIANLVLDNNGLFSETASVLKNFIATKLNA